MYGIKKTIGIMAVAAVAMSSATAQQPVDYVNPIIGTNGMGHTFPGCLHPFRMYTVKSGHRHNST